MRVKITNVIFREVGIQSNQKWEYKPEYKLPEKGLLIENFNMKQSELPFLCSLKGGFIKGEEPSDSPIQAVRECISNSPYPKQFFAKNVVGMDNGNFNKAYDNSTKFFDALVPIMKVTRSLKPLITIAKEVGQEVYPLGTMEKKEKELQSALTELESLQKVIRGAVSESSY